MNEKEGKKEKNFERKNNLLFKVVIVILLTCALPGALSIKPPVILQKGDQIECKEGDELILKCQGDEALIWGHSERTFNLETRSTSSETFAKGEHLSTLVLRGLRKNDTGVYFCRYKKPELSGYVDSIYVNVTKNGGGGMSPMLKTVLSVIIVTLVLVLLALVIFRGCKMLKSRNKRRKMKKNRDPEMPVPDERVPCLDGHPENELFRGAVEHLDPTLSLSDQADLLPFESHWEFPRERLHLGTQLGSGAFGRVMKAEAIGAMDTEPSTTVAVKMVKPNADENHLRALICELKIMANLGMHINVVNLVGACTKNLSRNNELYVIVEYCKHGSLLNYIRRYSKCFVNQIALDGEGNEIIDPSITESIETSSSFMEGGTTTSTYNDSMNYAGGGLISGSSDDAGAKQHSDGTVHRSDTKRDPTIAITTTDLLSWGFQIARGMEYLAARKVIHGDLAARNVLLTENNVVKICDFGLAKEMYKDYNYIMSTKGGRFPVKWMAIESINYGELSSESDCWSFGVVLWELFSLGKMPYPGLKADEELIKRIDKGYRMHKPEYCPSSVYKIMLDCWALEKGNRPPFAGLVNRIGFLMDKKLCDHFVELNAEYVRRNQASASAIISKGQTFPELDSYGYLKPIEMMKSKVASSSPDSSEPASTSANAARNSENGIGINYYVRDPTAPPPDDLNE